MDFSNGKCSTHKKSRLYFICKTHDIFVCRECTVLEHPPSKCKVEEIKNEVLQTKQNALKNVEQIINRLGSERPILEAIIVGMKEGIISKKEKIDCILKEIDEDCKLRDQAQDILEEKSIIKQLQDCSEKLQNATTYKKDHPRMLKT